MHATFDADPSQTGSVAIYGLVRGSDRFSVFILGAESNVPEKKPQRNHNH